MIKSIIKISKALSLLRRFCLKKWKCRMGTIRKKRRRSPKKKKVADLMRNSSKISSLPAQKGRSNGPRRRRRMERRIVSLSLLTSPLSAKHPLRRYRSCLLSKSQNRAHLQTESDSIILVYLIIIDQGLGSLFSSLSFSVGSFLSSFDSS